MKKSYRILACLTAVMLLAGCTAGSDSGTSSSGAGSSGTAAQTSDSTGTADTATSGDAAGGEIEAVTLKLGTTAPPTVQVSQSAAMFGEKLEAISGGKMTLDINYAGALGTTAQHYSQMEQGDLDMFVTAFDTETAMKDSQDFAIFVAPYAFDDNDHLRAFLETDKFREMLTKVENANGVKYLGMTGNLLPRALSTKNTPVVTPDDLKGLKIRTPESTAVVEVWSAWGATPVQTPGSEIYSSLESGLMDGQDNDVIGMTGTKLYEVQSYYMEINYIMQGNVMWISQKTWDSLNETQQGWIMEAMQQTDAEFSTDLEAQYAAAKQENIDNGITFVEFDIEAFRASAADVIDKLDGQLWSAGLYEYIRNMDR